MCFTKQKTFIELSKYKHFFISCTIFSKCALLILWCIYWITFIHKYRVFLFNYFLALLLWMGQIFFPSLLTRSYGPVFSFAFWALALRTSNGNRALQPIVLHFTSGTTVPTTSTSLCSMCLKAVNSGTCMNRCHWSFMCTDHKRRAPAFHHSCHSRLQVVYLFQGCQRAFCAQYLQLYRRTQADFGTYSPVSASHRGSELLWAAQHPTALPHFDLTEVKLVTSWFKALQLCQPNAFFKCTHPVAVLDCSFFQSALARGRQNLFY